MLETQSTDSRTKRMAAQLDRIIVAHAGGGNVITPGRCGGGKSTEPLSVALV
jgi:hypothetical protein